MILRRGAKEEKQGRAGKKSVVPARPFERWLYTLRAGGPGAPADWGAFREARAPCAACEKCKETKTLDHFSDRQWERVRANQSAICLACGPGKGEQKTLKRKLPSGLARLDCRGCKLRKLEDAFPRAQLQQDNSEWASTGSATIAGTSSPASCCISHTPSANCKSKTGHGGQAELSTRYGRDKRALRRQESFASSASEPAGTAPLRLLPRAFPAGAADSRPRHGRHRAAEFGSWHLAQTSRAAQTLDLLQTLQAAAPGLSPGVHWQHTVLCSSCLEF